MKSNVFVVPVLLFVLILILLTSCDSKNRNTNINNIDLTALMEKMEQQENEIKRLNDELNKTTADNCGTLTASESAETVTSPASAPIASGYLTIVAPAYNYNKDRGSYAECSGNNEISIAGDKYEYAVELGAQQVWDAFAIYNLKGEYTKFTGMLCHSDDAGEYANNSAIFRIYLDDDEVLSLEVTASMSPYDIELDITDVKAMKFVLEGNEFNGSAVYAIGNPYVE